MQDRDGIGRRELDTALCVDQQEAVAHPGCPVAEALHVSVRKLACLDHGREPVEDRQISALLLAGRTALRAESLAYYHADRVPRPSDRDSHHVDISIGSHADRPGGCSSDVEGFGD